jgi:serine protease Do
VETATDDVSPTARSPRYRETGILVSGREYVVINALYTRLSEELVAIFPDGRRHAARLVARDVFSNLALVKLDPSDNPPAPLGKSEDLNVGDPVFGVRSATDGTRQVVFSRVRDTRRFVRSETSLIGPYLEIDAPELFPGSGPIFDGEGRVVGFLALRTGPEYKAQAFFALPIEEVIRLSDEMRVSGRVRRSRIGIAIKSPPRSTGSARGLARPAGALVARVDRNGPAERGGMLAGDIIVRLASEEVRSTDDFLAALQRIRAGTRIQVEVVRDDGRHTLSLITGEVVSGPQVGEPGLSTTKVLPDEH